MLVSKPDRQKTHYRTRNGPQRATRADAGIGGMQSAVRRVAACVAMPRTSDAQQRGVQSPPPPRGHAPEEERAPEGAAWKFRMVECEGPAGKSRGSQRCIIAT